MLNDSDITFEALARRYPEAVAQYLVQEIAKADRQATRSNIGHYLEQLPGEELLHHANKVA